MSVLSIPPKNRTHKKTQYYRYFLTAGSTGKTKFPFSLQKALSEDSIGAGHGIQTKYTFEKCLRAKPAPSSSRGAPDFGWGYAKRPRAQPAGILKKLECSALRKYE